MSMPIHGKWFSGRTMAAREVTLLLDGDCLRLSGSEGPDSFPAGSVRISDRLGQTARFIYLPDGSSVESLDNDAIDSLLALRRRGRVIALLHWLEQRSTIAAVATVILAATLAAGVFYGLPWAARLAAQNVPQAIERRAGDTAFATLNSWFAPSNLTADDRARVTAQMARIVAARRLPIHPRIEFRSMGKFPNAFALPGGTLVLSDELVNLAIDDELAAVLAHETGHWQLQHGLQAIFRNSAALLVVTTLTGDLSTLTTFAGALPLLLVQRGYARELETEADTYALETLRLARIEAKHLASILEKLARSRPATGNDFSYLSTHPSTKDRIERIDPTGSYKKLPASLIQQTDRPHSQTAEDSGTSKTPTMEAGSSIEKFEVRGSSVRRIGGKLTIEEDG